MQTKAMEARKLILLLMIAIGAAVTHTLLAVFFISIYVQAEALESCQEQRDAGITRRPSESAARAP